MKKLMIVPLMIVPAVIASLVFAMTSANAADTGKSASGQTVRKVFIVDENQGPNLVKENRFGKYQLGFVREGDVFTCVNENASEHRGVAQPVTLNQKTPDTIVASLESKAENVSGRKDNNYSLYLDLVYQDGTSLWGQAVPFSTGTHDWEQKSVTIFPSKPVKSLSMYGLMRSHSGKAQFRNFKLSTVSLPGISRYDAVISSPVQAASASGEMFLLRNVGANSDFICVGQPDSGNSQTNSSSGKAFDVSVQWKKSRQSGACFYDVVLKNETNEDRVLTFYYTIDAPKGEIVWYETPRRSAVAVSPSEYTYTSVSSVGSNGRLSYYPFGAIGTSAAGSEGGKGIAVGLDPLYPVYYRIAYQSEVRQLFLACDVALTKEKKTATLRFLRYEFPTETGFRGALAEYYRLFPESFRCRTPKQGNWMAFHKISKVQGYEDFHFQFKEGNDEPDWDDAHGITTFRYTEPMTWWMSIPKDKPRTTEAAIEQAKTLAKKGNRAAQALLTSGHYDEEGVLVAQILDTPWCDGAVWSLCDLPGLVPLVQKGKVKYSEEYPVAGFELKWNPDLQKKLYPHPEVLDGKGLDGEYIDSSEGYVTAILDHRRDHFAAADRPLTYDRETLKPGIFRGLIAYEYAKKMADDVHGMNRLMMANSTPSRLFWLTTVLDVVGTETNWNHNNHWSPMSDDILLYRRAVCGPKPYCFLMNTNFDEFTFEMSEKYMKRSLAYGMFPSFFSANASTGHYFSRPELYNRDRPLFKKYLPLCRRVAEAGWQPVTDATSSDSKVYVERYGKDRKNIALTVFNDSQEKKAVTITLTPELLKLFGQPKQLKDLVTGRPAEVKNGNLQITLTGEDVAVLVP